MADWIVAEPGRLVLNGTRWSVRYDPTNKLGLIWRIYDDDRNIEGRSELANAKREAERRQAELVEVGLE